MENCHPALLVKTLREARNIDGGEIAHIPTKYPILTKDVTRYTEWRAFLLQYHGVDNREAEITTDKISTAADVRVGTCSSFMRFDARSVKQMDSSRSTPSTPISKPTTIKGVRYTDIFPLFLASEQTHRSSILARQWRRIRYSRCSTVRYPSVLLWSRPAAQDRDA